jgi:hypothetical protein
VESGAVVEGFFSSLKYELVYHHTFATLSGSFPSYRVSQARRRVGSNRGDDKRNRLRGDPHVCKVAGAFATPTNIFSR